MTFEFDLDDDRKCQRDRDEAMTGALRVPSIFGVFCQRPKSRRFNGAKRTEASD